MKPGDLTGERPLLLDPCADDPEKSFLYTPLGQIEPVPGDRRAEESIRVFHLTRRRLQDRRREHIDALVTVLRLLGRLREHEPETVAQLKNDLEGNWFADSAPFAEAARFVRRDPEAFGI